MTILVKKVFISSKPTFVCLLCPPLCGPFSIQESAAGGLSYKVKKNVPWNILAPRAVACDDLHLRASVHLWHVSAFLCNGEFLGISYYSKKDTRFQSSLTRSRCLYKGNIKNCEAVITAQHRL